MPAAPKKVGVLFSGGLDSAALIRNYLKNGTRVYPIYIQSDLPWEKIERYWIKRFLRALPAKQINPLIMRKIPLADAYRTNWSKTGKVPGPKSADQAVFLPARNLILLSHALLALAPLGVYDFALATLKGNPFSDAKPSFFRLLEKVFSQSLGKKVHIHTPFRNFKKKDVIGSCSYLPLELTFSCINPKDKYHCGGCNKCAERKRAFKNAGVVDKTFYKN